MFTLDRLRPFIVKVDTLLLLLLLLFFSVFHGFIVAFSNFFKGESPGRSALETGFKWGVESLIEFLGWQVVLGKRGLERRRGPG